MELSRHYEYLTLSYDLTSNQHIVKIHQTLPDALIYWGPCTRISPIFGVKKFGTHDPKTKLFSGNHYLIFMGPVMPAAFTEAFEPSFSLWLTLGLFNIVIDVNSETLKQEISEWAKGRGVRYEIWQLSNELIVDFHFSPPRETHPDLTFDIAKIAQTHSSPEVRELIREYCTLMTSTIARANQAVPKLLSDLFLCNCLVGEILRDDSKENFPSFYLLQSQMTKIPDGHLKIPHLWPGQNPPGDSREIVYQ